MTGGVKVKIPAKRLQLAARTRAPFCGVQWQEGSRPLVIHTRMLKAAVAGREVKAAAVFSNGSPENPGWLRVEGKGFCYMLKHQRQFMEELAKWAEGERKRIAQRAMTPEGKAAAARLRKLEEARKRLRLAKRRHGMDRPRHPLAVAKREFAGPETEARYREYEKGNQESLRMRRTIGFIAGHYLRERGRHWQRDLNAELAARGLKVRYGYARLSKLQSGRWITAQYGNYIETYLKGLWRDVIGTEHAYFRERPEKDLAAACREWRDVDVLKYLEWRQRERMLLQDIQDLESGYHGEAEASGN